VGWLVEPFDVGAFADEITRRYAQPGLEAVAEEGRKFAAGYNWDALADRQAEAYRAALEALSATTGRQDSAAERD
jgi:hypothetical protein